MTEAVVLLERRDDGVAVVTLNNGKVNALSSAVVAALHEIADELTADPPGAVVVTGGERIFAAGADISEFGGAEEAVGITARIHAALDALAAIPRFVIAAVSGTRSVVAASCRWRATIGSPASGPCSGSPRSCWARFPAVAVPSAWRARSVRAAPRRSRSPAARSRPTRRCGSGSPTKWCRRGATRSGVRARGGVCTWGGAVPGARRTGDRSRAVGVAGRRLADRAGVVRRIVPTNDSQIGVKSFLEHGPGKAEFTGT